MAKNAKSLRLIALNIFFLNRKGNASRPAARYITKELHTADMPASSNQRKGYQIIPHKLDENSKAAMAKRLCVVCNVFMTNLIPRLSYNPL